MKIRELLVELKLPVNWDKTLFLSDMSYKKKIEYAINNGEKLGSGRDRTAIKVKFDNRNTVIKVAMNKTGIIQNKVESNILNDRFVKFCEIAVPIIDYDADHPEIIHVELAEKVTEKQICDIVKCGSLINLISAANHASGADGPKTKSLTSIYKELSKKYNYTDEEINTFEHYVVSLAYLRKFGLILWDLTRADNWGMFNNKPVIIDLGFVDK